MRTPVRSRRTDRSAFLRATIGLALIVVAWLALASPASAQDAETGPRDEQIVLSGRLLVAEGETVDSAVIFNGPAAIEGTVTESVVVFNGRTEVSGTVGGDVVVFNGSVTVRSGATIGGNLVTVDDPEVEPGATVRGEQRRVSTDFDATAFGFASRLAWWIGYSVSTLLLGLALLALAPGLDLAVAAAARERTGATIGFGAGAFFLLPVAAVLLLVIVVAIPLGLFLLLAFALLYTIGYVAGAHVLGRRLMEPPKSRFVAFLVGWAILRAIALIPLVGGLTWMVTAIVGLGALWVAARFGASSAPSAPESLAVPPMPPTAS
ncbi:MAG TPA: polymer-forming cytoskeletal protein [Actinomycetota bacterium]|nr:polymer-forming cytoskeletal protein [Actinomycetota bacterium]